MKTMLSSTKTLFILICLSAIFIGSTHCSCSKHHPNIQEPDSIPQSPQPGGGDGQKDPDEEEDPTYTGVKFKHMLGVNGFEWEFLLNSQNLDKVKTDLIKPFAEFRHYLDWHRIETTEGEYTFNPTASGSWNLDEIYEWCNANQVELLTCIKTVPDWFLRKYYPANQRDEENAPTEGPKDQPGSYKKFAQVAFQFAARYGSNKNVDPALVQVAPIPTWSPNVKKIGLGLVRYIECNNEADRWWKGDAANQTPEQYAANMSAFYDGHKGALGPGVGVKQADPNMVVVMGGLANPSIDYVKRMVEWCRKNRGLKADGSVDLCFDVINYHHYSNSKNSDWSAPGVRGQAPEISQSPKVAREFIQYAKNNLNGMPVWVTELGYDINPNSPQRALAINKNNKSILETQADWSIRSSLMYAREGISKIHFYMLNDVDPNSSTQYASSGFVTSSGHRRPALNYVQQMRQLLGEFHYVKTHHSNPFVDEYALGKRKIFALVVPDETGKEITYELSVNTSSEIIKHELQAGSTTMKSTRIPVENGKITLTITETPLFIELL
jgi:hypothetical protein